MYATPWTQNLAPLHIGFPRFRSIIFFMAHILIHFVAWLRKERKLAHSTTKCLLVNFFPALCCLFLI
jgi:hypothetical protein